MPAASERVSTVHGRIPGTALDRRVRVTGGMLTSLQKVLARTEANLAETIRVREKEIAGLRTRIALVRAEHEEARAEKREKEPGQFIVSGLRTRGGVPPGVTPEEWVELRKSGKYVEYL